MKHYTVQSTPKKKYADLTREERSTYRRNLYRLKKGIMIPGLCSSEGCNNIRYSPNGNCDHCQPCKKRLSNETSARFQVEYKRLNGMSYYDAGVLEETKAQGVVQEKLEV